MSSQGKAAPSAPAQCHWCTVGHALGYPAWVGAAWLWQIQERVESEQHCGKALGAFCPFSYLGSSGLCRSHRPKMKAVSGSPKEAQEGGVGSGQGGQGTGDCWVP